MWSGCHLVRDHERLDLNHFRCVTYCEGEGYDYAGLQYSSQCICSNSGPQGNSDESQCTYGCAGDSSINMCGGLGYINIFHTDAHKTTVDDFGCGSTAQDTYYQRWFDDMSHCDLRGKRQLWQSSFTIEHKSIRKTSFSRFTVRTLYSRWGERSELGAHVKPLMRY